MGNMMTSSSRKKTTKRDAHLEVLGKGKTLTSFLEAPEVRGLVLSCRRLRAAYRDTKTLPPDGDLRTKCWFEEGRRTWQLAVSPKPMIRRNPETQPEEHAIGLMKHGFREAGIASGRWHPSVCTTMTRGSSLLA